MGHWLQRRGLHLGFVGSIALASSACTDNRDFGESVAIPQSIRHSVGPALGPSRAIHLPDDFPFNVVDTQRQSSGQATATSSASSSGRARCSADASTGGSAVAEFQIGHVLTYDATERLAATVTFNVAYRCSIQHDGAAFSAEPVQLKVYVMDSQRRILGKAFLTGTAADRLPERWTGSQSHAFDLAIRPDLAYHFIVAGRVQVSGGDTAGPQATIEVQSLDILISPRSG